VTVHRRRSHRSGKLRSRHRHAGFSCRCRRRSRPALMEPAACGTVRSHQPCDHSSTLVDPAHRLAETYMLQTHTSGGAGSSTSEPNAAAVATTDACSPLAAIDYRAFAADVSALHAELKSDLGTADLRHLRRMEAWGRACTLIG